MDASPRLESPHPSTDDLLKLAQECLGQKRTERILTHCRDCPPCADRLLATISAEPSPKNRPAVSIWLWISLGVLLLAVAALLGGLWWLASQSGGL